MHVQRSEGGHWIPQCWSYRAKKKAQWLRELGLGLGGVNSLEGNQKCKQIPMLSFVLGHVQT